MHIWFSDYEVLAPSFVLPELLLDAWCDISNLAYFWASGSWHVLKCITSIYNFPSIPPVSPLWRGAGGDRKTVPQIKGPIEGNTTEVDFNAQCLGVVHTTAQTLTRGAIL